MIGRNRLLIIDDDRDLCDYVADVAAELGFETKRSVSDEELAAIFSAFDPTTIFLDLHMPGRDGIEVLQWLADRNFDGEIYLASGMDRKVIESAANLAESFGLKIGGILPKPVLLDDLEAVLSGSLRNEMEITSEELHAAIDNGGLVLHYQPKIRMGGGAHLEIDSCEALVRWEHEKHGLVPPNEFIPLAEENGLIAPLTDAVLLMAARQAKEWREIGVTTKIAVNVPPHLFAENAFLGRVSDLLRKFDLPASTFIFEVTERTLIEDAMEAMETLTRLRIMGAGLSIDDFGTGHSSLIQLHQMPFSEIKIDMSFVDAMEKSADARTIVRAIINLAHDLGMKCCAEGVERAATLEALELLNCDYAQGYIFYPALEKEKMTALLCPAEIDVRAAGGQARVGAKSAPELAGKAE